MKRKKGNAVSSRPNAPAAFGLKAIEKKANKHVKSSRQLDEFDYVHDIITPPYEPGDLIMLVERNDSLRQNIEAIATNVCGFGHGIKYADDFDYTKAKSIDKKKADAGWGVLQRLYKYINPLTDFKDIAKKMVLDRHTIGWGTIEVLRNTIGEVCGLEYCRACNVRLVKNKDAECVVNVYQQTSGGYEKVENTVRFRKFVQIINGDRRYFKEFGDPRIMNYEDGEYGDDTPEGLQATEIAYFPIHSSYTDYGVPHWINVSLCATGSVMADVLNVKYFEDGRMIPAAIIVGGGGLTEESIERLKSGRELENAYNMMLLEALPEKKESFSDEKEQKVTIDIKPMTDTNNNDALFRGFKQDTKSAIREAFRLPPIYTGASADYNRATAETATGKTEEQVMEPERKFICGVFNKIINNELGIKHCELYFKGPDISDTDEKVSMLRLLLDAGTLTPNHLIDLASAVLNIDLEPWDEEQGNVPFALLMKDSANEEQTGGFSPQGRVQKSEGNYSGIAELSEMVKETLYGLDGEQQL